MAAMAAILVLGVLRAGSRYFTCGAMGTLSATSCCDGSHPRDADGARIETRNEDCCKAHTMGSLPAAAISVITPTPPAHRVAVLPPAAAQLPPMAPHPSVLPGAQTGPPRLGAPNDRSRLMVFLI